VALREATLREAASREAAFQEAAARAAAARAPSFISVVQGSPFCTAKVAAAGEAGEREGVTQEVAVLQEGTENTKITTPAVASSPPNHDASVDQFINVLLNVDHDTQKFMIIKLVSNIDLRRSIEEVLLTILIISQATFNKSTVNWEECTPPYAGDKRAFRNHTRGKKKSLPSDSDPNIRTVGERITLSRAKKKVLKAFVGIGTLEQQRLILLRVLSDPSFQNISSSIGINMKENKLGQQLLRCARK